MSPHNRLCLAFSLLRVRCWVLVSSLSQQLDGRFEQGLTPPHPPGKHPALGQAPEGLTVRSNEDLLCSPSRRGRPLPHQHPLPPTGAPPPLLGTGRTRRRGSSRSAAQRALGGAGRRRTNTCPTAAATRRPGTPGHAQSGAGGELCSAGPAGGRGVRGARGGARGGVTGVHGGDAGCGGRGGRRGGRGLCGPRGARRGHGGCAGAAGSALPAERLCRRRPARGPGLPGPPGERRARPVRPDAPRPSRRPHYDMFGVSLRQISHNTWRFRFGLPSSDHVLGLPIGNFSIKPYKTSEPEKKLVSHLGMIAGGTGITPMLQLIRHITKNPNDRTRMSLIFANQTEEDILVRRELEEVARTHPDQFDLWYTLDRPPVGWKYSSGYITANMIKEHLPPPGQSTLILVCGPMPLIQTAAHPNLEKLGYTKEMIFTY
uniref:NADH-cytochrome b5 reductase 2 n=1 Tax=Canis lupus familiaris TaxID=9615 RepID=A0A8C0QDL3_CANLF